MAEYKTVRKNAQDQFVEKRSRFIGYACPVQTEQEALDFITSKKSGHWDACLLYTSPSPRDAHESRMPSSA